MKHFYSLLTFFCFTSFIYAQDTCDTALPLTCGTLITGTTTDNTNTAGSASPDEYYSYTGNGDVEEITISLCNGNTNYDSFLRVYSGCDLSLITQNDDTCGLQSEVSFISNGTDTYIIMIEGFNANSGDFEMEVSCVSGLTNDNCNFATPISCDETLEGDTTEDTDSGGNEANDEFFVFEANGFEEEITISLCNGATNYDSFIRVYDSCSLVNQIANNDDSCGLQSELTFTAEGTNTYYIMVEGYQANVGAFEITVTCSGPPIPPPNDHIENAISLGDATFNYTDANALTQNATEEDGNPVDCSLVGFEGVWYVFETTSGGGTVNATIESPNGVQAVIFFEAPSTNATVDQLTRVDQENNPCFVGNVSTIEAESNKIYYVFVANMGAPTDVTITLLTLGIETQDTSGFEMYPNPVEDSILLSALQWIDTVTIYNMQGQVVYTTQINAQQKELSLGFLASGSYVMQSTMGSKNEIRQLIKK